MESRNEPFYRKSRRAWYLQVGKRQIKLSESKAESWAKWHLIMAGGVPEESNKPTVKNICDAFIEEMKTSRSERTWQWYEGYSKRLIQYVKGDAAAESVSLSQISLMISSQRTWKANSRYNFARAIKRLFSWAKKNRLIEIDPIEHLEKCSPEAREDYITPEQWSFIESNIPSSPLKDLMILAWDTGMRPQELVLVEARHFRKDERMIVFPAAESKGKKYVRTVYIASDRAMEILSDYAKGRSEGPIMVNTKGNPWNKTSVKDAMIRLRNKFGVKIHLGAFRKGYCTQALQNGVDPVTLAKLMGHRDVTMIMKVYSQVHQDKEYMAESAMKAKGLVKPA